MRNYVEKRRIKSIRLKNWDNLCFYFYSPYHREDKNYWDLSEALEAAHKDFQNEVELNEILDYLVS